MICVSLGNIGFNHCIELLLQLECAEIRLDLMDLNDEEIKLIFSEPCNLVATCRPGKYSDDERTQLLLHAIQCGAQYIDIEFEADTKYRHKIQEHAWKKGVKVIISYHDFEKTSSTEELESIIQQAQIMGADIVKIATMAHTPSDCASVMALYRKEKDIIAFCMGKAGMITRIAAPFLGAEFTYAAIDETHSIAPGQLTLEEMENVFKVLHAE